MPLRIEAWSGDYSVGGIDQWWDDVDAWMYADEARRSRYPILASFDPYGFGSVPSADFPALLTELAEVAAEAPPPVADIAVRLTNLCAALVEDSSAELRLVGD